MGITHTSAMFAGPVPDLGRIAAEMMRRSGLEVSVRNSAPEVTSTVFAMHGELSFACVNREHVKVYSYRPWVPREPDEAMLTALADIDPNLVDQARRAFNGGRVEGDHHSVHVQGYVSEEGTLFDVTALALESLGGSLSGPVSDERRQRCCAPITPSALRARHRAHSRAFVRELFKGLGQLTSALARRLWRRAS
jgi:hypothetical protein